jgi:hypothetical protein
MYGPQAVSEQQLAEEALQRLPADAVVLADGNFGIFAFAHAVQRSQRPLLLRLTAARAQKILGNAVSRKGTHRKVIWNASRWDQEKAEYAQRMDFLLEYAAQARLPQRCRIRSYPRQVWGRGASVPTRRSRPATNSTP